MASDLIVVGAGGFGRETLDVVRALNARDGAWNLLGVVDDAPSRPNLDRLERLEVPFLGALEFLVQHATPCHYVVAIGSPQVRSAVVERLGASQHTPATLVHPSATVGSDTRLGPGTVVCSGAQVSTNVTLDSHVHLNANATVGHDSVLGRFVSLNPMSTVSGECVVEDQVLIGAAAVVLNQLRVGRGAVVGAAACVVRSVPAGAIVKGVPAR